MGFLNFVFLANMKYFLTTFLACEIIIFEFAHIADSTPVDPRDLEELMW